MVKIYNCCIFPWSFSPQSKLSSITDNYNVQIHGIMRRPTIVMITCHTNSHWTPELGCHNSYLYNNSKLQQIRYSLIIFFFSFLNYFYVVFILVDYRIKNIHIIYIWYKVYLQSNINFSSLIVCIALPFTCVLSYLICFIYHTFIFI